MNFNVNFTQIFNKIRHLALTFIATRLVSNKTIKKLIESFYQLDSNNDGLLSY